jgi:peroxiredoxin
MSQKSLTLALEHSTPAGAQEDLLALSRKQRLLVVFLRHAGCTFCREALSELQTQRERIEAAGAKIVLVHMSSAERGKQLASNYGLDDTFLVSDPDRRLYEAFELRRGNAWQLFGPAVWWRGLVAGIMKGHGVGMLEGDGFQMPGAFLVQGGVILRAFRHSSAGDRPDYCELASKANV